MTGAATTRPAPDMHSPEQEELALADVIARLRRAMRRAARMSDPANTLSVAQLELLSCVAEHPGVRPSRVARLLQLAPNSVTTLVNGLESRALISRSGGEADRRTVALTLTARGRRAVHRWQGTNVAILHRALQQLHPGHQQSLAAAMPALHELVHAIDAYADTPVEDRVREQP